MAKKKTSKKTTEPKVEPKAEPTPEPAITDEQVITVRGAGMGGVKTFTRSEYDKTFSKE